MGEWFLVFSQLYYTISGEELFIFYNKKEPYLCGLWRFANAYYHLYFRGDNSQPIAYIEVKVYGSENPTAFDALTGEICKIFNEVLGIAPDHIYVKYEAVKNWGWNGANL